MINPGTYNITAYQGANYSKTFTITQSDVPFDLTGYTAAMQVREGYSSPNALLSLTSGSGIVLGGTAGTVQINISASQSSAIPAGAYAYDLELTLSGAVTRLLQGSFSVVGNITK